MNYRKQSVVLMGVLLCGCASYHNTKGNAQIAMDQSEDGVQSLGVAAKKSPRSPDYQIDYLTQRDKYTREFLSEADALRADGKLPEARTAYERALRLDAANTRALDGLLALQQDARHEKILLEGERHLEQGKLDAAQERVNLVLESNPKNKRALKLKAEVLDARTEKQIAQDKARPARTFLGEVRLLLEIA